MTEEAKKSYSTLLFFLTTLVVFVTGYFVMKGLPPIADENAHFKQIIQILDGSNLVPNHCPYLPGYHWSVALLSKALHNSNGWAIRLAATSLNFLAFLSFFLAAKKLDSGSAIQKSYLFLFFPFFYPFFFVLYTDLYSMLFVFLAIWLALKQRLWFAGIVSILGLLVRQNNIFWFVLAAMIAYADAYYPQYQWKDVKRWIFKFSFFFLAVFLLLAFAVWNKGFVWGDRHSHPFTLNFNNLFACLFFGFFLFLPLHLSNAKKIFEFLKRNKIMWLILIELFLVYVLFFKVTHRYNSFGRFLHNWIFWIMAASIQSKILTFFPIAYTLLSFCVTPLQKKSFYWLYPLTALSLLPLPVLEIRYPMIPYALFLLFKERDSEQVAQNTLAIYFVASACLLNLMSDNSFFP